LSGRKQPIRGLWIRGTRYYARLNVENPLTGIKKNQRVPLITKDGDPVQTVAQAMAELKRLQTQRSDNTLPMLARTPKFDDYSARYLKFIGSGQGTKKPGTVEKEKALLKRWSNYIGGLRLDQIKRVLHLHHRLVIQPFAPLMIFHGFGARWWRRIEQRLCEILAQIIRQKCRRVRNNGRDFLVQPRLVAAAEDEPGHKIRRAPRGFTHRHAETKKIFGVHIKQKLVNGIQSRLAAQVSPKDAESLSQELDSCGVCSEPES